MARKDSYDSHVLRRNVARMRSQAVTNISGAQEREFVPFKLSKKQKQKKTR